MNWQQLVQGGHIPPEAKLIFAGKSRQVHARVCGKKLVCDNKEYARPAQIWTEKFARECRKTSWWDGALLDGVSLRNVRDNLMQVRERTRRPQKKTPKQPDSPATAVMTSGGTPPRKSRRYQYQRKLTPVGRPAKVKSCGWSVSKQVTPSSRADYVRKNYAKYVLKFDADGDGFVCKCGVHVDLTNSNYVKNLQVHFSSESCVAARERKNRSITEFFRPAPRHARPDSDIYCLGLWADTVSVDGKDCDTSLLGEYACSRLFFVSTRSFTVEARGNEEEKHTITRSIYSAECLGHALDQNDRLRPSRNCLACSSLPENADFQRMLLLAQDVRRFEYSHKLPNKYYSWRHLQVHIHFMHIAIMNE